MEDLTGAYVSICNSGITRCSFRWEIYDRMQISNLFSGIFLMLKNTGFWVNSGWDAQSSFTPFPIMWDTASLCPHPRHLIDGGRGSSSIIKTLLLGVASAGPCWDFPLCCWCRQPAVGVLWKGCLLPVPLEPVWFVCEPYNSTQVWLAGRSSCRVVEVGRKSSMEHMLFPRAHDFSVEFLRFRAHVCCEARLRMTGSQWNGKHLFCRLGIAHGTSGWYPFHMTKFLPRRSCWACEGYSCPEHLMEIKIVVIFNLGH